MTHRVNCHILQAYHLFFDINKYKLQTFEKKRPQSTMSSLHYDVN